MDLGWLRSNLRADRTDPTLMTLPVHRVLSEVWNVIRLRERSDTFTIDDPKPAMEEIAGLFARVFLPALWFLNPIRRYTQARVLKALRNASSVLFICKGNICRSPFAELYARTRLPNIRVSSVGLLPASGRSSPDAAIEAAAARNIDLSLHRSRVLSEQDLRSYDIIFVFDVDQFRAIKRLAKQQQMTRKVFFLGSLDIHQSLAIADPYGKDLRNFEETYDKIARLIDGAVATVNAASARSETSTGSQGAAR
jgi:protein-tyrosine phosphatase